MSSTSKIVVDAYNRLWFLCWYSVILIKHKINMYVNWCERGTYSLLHCWCSPVVSGLGGRVLLNFSTRGSILLKRNMLIYSPIMYFICKSCWCCCFKTWLGTLCSNRTVSFAAFMLFVLVILMWHLCIPHTSRFF